jgi:hypothetical protein
MRSLSVRPLPRIIVEWSRREKTEDAKRQASKLKQTTNVKQTTLLPVRIDLSLKGTNHVQKEHHIEETETK